MTTLESSQWIARATSHVRKTRRPTLALCYLPHLDYGLQKWGPNPDDSRIAKDLREIDGLAGELIVEAEAEGDRVIVVSEYGIVPVRSAVHINRALRAAGLVRVREEMGRELLDAGASKAFAVSDHQLAHVYLQHGADAGEVRKLLEHLEGVDVVLDEAGKREMGLDHPRSGDLVALSAPDRWFSYYWWTDDAKAPDFARTVDIHRKPGYDPMELFLDPELRWPNLHVARRLLARKLGFRNLLDVIPIKDTTLVKGSHGRITTGDDAPLVMSNEKALLPEDAVLATSFKDLVLAHVFGR
jgi:predicted AlkP superfamily pyrophosphatase or phosphodiesterase